MDDLLNGGAGVVLLGRSGGSALVIRTLNRRYGIVPTLFAEKRIWQLLPLLRYRFVRCLRPNNKYYVQQSLLDMAAEPHDVRTVLMPLTSRFRKYVFEMREIFENEYIIREPEQLLPEQTSPAEGRARA